MRIAICDDDPIWCECAEKTIREYGQSADRPFDLVCFTQGQALIDWEKPLDVLFLDIEMGEGNDSGISLAGKINRRWPQCQIVYLTNYIAYATEVHHTVHSYYMLKDLLAERLDEIFAKIDHEQAQRRQKLIFTLIGNKTLSVAPQRILYFERIRRTTRIVTATDTYETTESISDILSRLPALDFCRCHNSYIVYFPAVEVKRKTSFTMSNGDEVVISRFYQQKIQQAFLDWAKMQ